MPCSNATWDRYISARTGVEYPSGMKKVDVVAKVDALGDLSTPPIEL